MAVMAITGGTAGVGKLRPCALRRQAMTSALLPAMIGAEATKRELLRYGVRVHTVEADVAHADALLAAAGEIENRLGRSTCGSITRCARCWRLSGR